MSTGGYSPYRLVDCRHGRFLANPNDIYIGRSLIEYGEYSETECQLLLKLVPEGGVVIEAGSNVGALTVPLARRAGPPGRVWAIEPEPLLFQLLCANLALNGLFNVYAVNGACGEEEGWLTIGRLNPAKENNFGGVPLATLTDRPSAHRVRIDPLDRIVRTARLDLIKADVEGMELVVLRGAAGLIRRHRPALYVEAHKPAPELLSWIAAQGYRAWWHLPPMFSPANFRGRADNIWNAPVASRNLVCLPSEVPAKMVGFREVSGPEDHPSRW